MGFPTETCSQGWLKWAPPHSGSHFSLLLGATSPWWDFLGGETWGVGRTTLEQDLPGTFRSELRTRPRLQHFSGLPYSRPHRVFHGPSSCQEEDQSLDQAGCPVLAPPPACMSIPTRLPDPRVPLPSHAWADRISWRCTPCFLEESGSERGPVPIPVSVPSRF